MRKKSITRIHEELMMERSFVTLLGIDDFSFKRGRKFGTILVDLSTHQVIDLLIERKIESAAKWMHSHPEIRYVSRDRGNEYSQAVCERASQAMAIADRFHLTKNLVEAIEPIVVQRYKQLRKAFPQKTRLWESELPTAVPTDSGRVVEFSPADERTREI
jgi:transposase